MINRRQAFALGGIAIMVLSTLGYALLSPMTPQEQLPANFYYIIPGVDLSGLTPEQRIEVLKTLNTEQCNCGCGYGSLAACRNLDPTCSVSLSRAQAIVARYLEENRRREESRAFEIDTDGDGLTDGEEEKLGLNSTNRDTDGDGLPDGLELKMGTDPLMIETVESIKEKKKALADARLEGRISSEEFFEKLEEYERIIAILENINATGGAG